MSEYERCRICGEYGWTRTHVCKPTWYVRPDYYDQEDEVTSFGSTPEEAAEKFLERKFEAFEHPSSMTVIVVNSAYTEQYTVEVEVQAVPEFNGSITKKEPITKEEEL